MLPQPINKSIRTLGSNKYLAREPSMSCFYHKAPCEKAAFEVISGDTTYRGRPDLSYRLDVVKLQDVDSQHTK